MHLNACLRKVVTRTLERQFLEFEMSGCVRSTSLSIFHSTPFGKNCACHVIITLSLWSEVASTSGCFNLKEIFT